MGARLLCGVGYGLNDAAVMGAALAWERTGKRSLVGRLYAGFSVGAVFGALLSGWLLRAGWSYSAILLIAAPLGLLMSGVAALAPYDHGNAPDRRLAAGRVSWCGALIALVLLSLCSSLVEALLAGWLVIDVRALGAGPLAASSAYAASDVALILGRRAHPARLCGTDRYRREHCRRRRRGRQRRSVRHHRRRRRRRRTDRARPRPAVRPDAGDAVARMLLAAGYFGFLLAGPLAGLLAGLLSVQSMLVGGMAVLGMLIAALALPASRRAHVTPPHPASPVERVPTA